jgi:hypothetical protein
MFLPVQLNFFDYMIHMSNFSICEDEKLYKKKETLIKPLSSSLWDTKSVSSQKLWGFFKQVCDASVPLSPAQGWH